MSTAEFYRNIYVHRPPGGVLIAFMARVLNSKNFSPVAHENK